MTAPAVAPARAVETLCKYLGLLNGAAPLYRSALRVATEAHDRPMAIRRRVFPAGHPAIAATLRSLAVLHESQGRHARAARLIRAAMTSEWRTARARRLEVRA
jgi:hypothetical protein